LSFPMLEGSIKPRSVYGYYSIAYYLHRYYLYGECHPAKSQTDVRFWLNLLFIFFLASVILHIVVSCVLNIRLFFLFIGSKNPKNLKISYD